MTDTHRGPLQNTDRLFIGGEWVKPSSAATIDVVDSATEERYFTVAEAQPADMARAVAAAREAFDDGPWPRLTHAERATYLRALADGLRDRAEIEGQLWPRETGVLHAIARGSAADAAGTFDYYAGLADVFPFEEPVQPTFGEFGLLVREPVGVVGAIIPWNGPLGLISYKVAPALIAGCTVVLKSSPEAPGEGYLVAEDRKGDRLTPGRVECRYRRTCSFRTASHGSPGGQDYVHRIHRRRTTHSVVVRRADRPLHARTRWQVGGRRS